MLTTQSNCKLDKKALKLLKTTTQVRALVQHLGAELMLLRDYKEMLAHQGIMEECDQRGEIEHMFTTILACYHYIVAQSHKTLGH